MEVKIMTINEKTPILMIWVVSNEKYKQIIGEQFFDMCNLRRPLIAI